MSTDKNIVITATAAISSVGLTVEQTCAAIRAGISSFTDHPYYYAQSPEPDPSEPELAVAASVPVIDPLLNSSDRLMELLVPPLSNLISDANFIKTKLQSGAFLLALPQQDEVVNSLSLESEFLPELYRRTGLDDFKFDKTNQLGSAGMFMNIIEAVSWLESGNLDFCIIGGVDSYLLGDRMACLDGALRLKSESNVDGYIPGEAASVLLLETDEHARKRNGEVLATILSSGLGKESHLISSDRNSSGAGLCDAIKTALSKRTSETDIQWVLCDLNGESYRSFEWGLVLTRLNSLLCNVTDVVHPADCVGDIGAATGGMLIANAIQAFQRGYNLADEALLWTASDDGNRAALCIGRC